MAGVALRGALAGAVVMLGGVACAADPVLPAPRPIVTEVAPPIRYIRPDPYAVWQNYGVDRTGRFRPLVVPFPDGEFRYMETGEPFPWWPNYSSRMRPMMGNPATFGGPAPALPLMIVEPAPVIKPATGWERMPYAE
jgi:hypothetical protein